MGALPNSVGTRFELRKIRFFRVLPETFSRDRAGLPPTTVQCTPKGWHPLGPGWHPALGCLGNQPLRGLAPHTRLNRTRTFLSPTLPCAHEAL